MQDGTLLFPDTGPDFLRALNQSAIYSETVHAFTFTNQATIDALEPIFSDRVVNYVLENSLLDAGNSSREAVNGDDAEGEKEASSLQKMLNSQSKERVIRLAEQEGVLHSIGEAMFKRVTKGQDSAKSALHGLMKVIRGMDVNTVMGNAEPLLQTAMLECPPSLWHLIDESLALMIELLEHSGHEDAQKLERMFGPERERMHTFAFGVYTILASQYAVANGLTPVSWQSDIHTAVASIMRGMRAGNPVHEMMQNRQSLTHGLGKLVLSEFVPYVGDLPFETILDIRRKRSDEVAAFRDGLAEVAAGMDCEADSAEMRLEFDAKIQTVFKPALRNLNRVTEEIRMESYRKLFQPDGELAMALVPVTLTAMAGQPLEINAASASLPLLQKLYEFTIGKHVENQKSIKACPWSLLFNLQQKKK